MFGRKKKYISWDLNFTDVHSFQLSVLLEETLTGHIAVGGQAQWLIQKVNPEPTAFGNNIPTTWRLSSPHAGSSLAHHWLQLIQEDGGWGVVPGQLKQNLQA